MFRRAQTADPALMELLRAFQRDSVEAIKQSAVQTARQDAHEKVCTERYDTLRKDQAVNHAQNQAAIAALGRRIWTLVVTVAGSVIVLLLGVLGWAIAMYVEHHL